MLRIGQGVQEGLAAIAQHQMPSPFVDFRRLLFDQPIFDQRAQGRLYRLYEVQNGNHIETYQDGFPQLELIMPHAQKAFDLLVQHVEAKVALPPSQCIPRGAAIAAAPAQPGHCAQLFVP